ncbi:hypothetical protein IMCC3317_20390 [Kordia antarctica]|uniref:Uncharacterized protein n=1 Tax=Kordia antarctica TaxID=1218801 RepID=A0A7L4ZKD3_9FLAO|nr:hypothetical protein IMCC3317_20390 [Kordia antarctica]
MEWIILSTLAFLILFLFTNRKQSGNFILASFFGVFGIVLFFLKKKKRIRNHRK